MLHASCLRTPRATTAIRGVHFSPLVPSKAREVTLSGHVERKLFPSEFAFILEGTGKNSLTFAIMKSKQTRTFRAMELQ